MPVLETFLMSCKELRALLKEIRAGYVRRGVTPRGSFAPLSSSRAGNRLPSALASRSSPSRASAGAEHAVLLNAELPQSQPPVASSSGS